MVIYDVYLKKKNLGKLNSQQRVSALCSGVLQEGGTLLACPCPTLQSRCAGGEEKVG